MRTLMATAMLLLAACGSPPLEAGRAYVAQGRDPIAVMACASPQIGRPFPIDPLRELKVGYDEKTDVLREMGQPYRSFVDSQGHEVFVYVWADGGGGGQKCLIAFNENDVVYLVELAP